MAIRSTLLDELTRTVIVDDEIDALSRVEADAPREPEMASSLRRIKQIRVHGGLLPSVVLTRYLLSTPESIGSTDVL